jgi:hypothetical protein
MQRNESRNGIGPITIEGGETTHKITMEEIEELHAEQHGEELIEGKPCICVSSSFRAVQLAFSKLWHENEGIPKREDIKIISTLPAEGSQQAFKYILGLEPLSKARGEFMLALPAGTDKKNKGIENYVFTVIRKSTNASFRVRVRQDVFPDGFFVLRKIVKHRIPKEATVEERKRYVEWESEVRAKFLTFSDDNLFIGELDE